MACATIVVSTSWRSSDEETAWLTSPRARSSSTERASSCVQLLEQPGVLDGDDGLVGERLQQADLRSVKRFGLEALIDQNAKTWSRAAAVRHDQNVVRTVAPIPDRCERDPRRRHRTSGTWMVRARRIARPADVLAPIGTPGDDADAVAATHAPVDRARSESVEVVASAPLYGRAIGTAEARGRLGDGV